MKNVGSDVMSCLSFSPFYLYFRLHFRLLHLLKSPNEVIPFKWLFRSSETAYARAASPLVSCPPYRRDLVAACPTMLPVEIGL